MSNSKTQITKRKTKAQKGRLKTKVCKGVQLLIKGTIILSLYTKLNEMSQILSTQY